MISSKTFLPLFLLLPLLTFADARDTLLPRPQAVQKQAGAFLLDASFRVEVHGPENNRAFGGASRFLRRLSDRTGLFFNQGFVRPGDRLEDPGLLVTAERRGELAVGMDESYTLSISSSGIRLTAPTDIGALRGLETLLQLLDVQETGYIFSAVQIEDAPRFPWRGLMLDVARHYMPMDMIKRNLDGMAAVKMNVMHWHLTEDQGFRIESKTYPRLHTYGSDGLYYTHEQVREILAYADERGIRVYPEFDIPGHATSWLVGHPELASRPGPYEIERKWGIFDPTLDPSNEAVYELLEGFFAEMATLFPDDYLHIGGDEVTGKHWEESERIQKFMRENDLADKYALQSYFNQRVLKILNKLDKKMIGWDEILQPDMPRNIVIHSWRGREAMEIAARDGYQSILSNGYYIDLMQPASFHYLNDPLPADHSLTPEEAARVLGGEATMWSEHVTPETVDSRIWPRTAAIAERLWSPREIRDVDSMYDRLEIIAVQLEEHGLTHLKNRPMLMRRLTRGAPIQPLATLADLVEPLKIYQRNADLSYSQFSPYTLLPDIAIADAPGARAFRNLVQRYLDSGRTDLKAERQITATLAAWAGNHREFAVLAADAPALREALPLSAALRDLAALGLELLARDREAPAPLPAWWATVDKTLENARQPVAKVELQVVDAVASLLPERE